MAGPPPAGLLNAVLQMVDAVHVRCDGRELLFFGGFDYHRLSRHPEVVAAAAEAARVHGLSTGGSRATTGTHPLHEELEQALAEFLHVDAALVVGSGYLANLIALQALSADVADAVLDERAHASLFDATAATGRRARTFAHAESDALADELVGLGRPLVATDGVFGATGTMPPLRDYQRRVLAADGWLLMDDCHAVGVVGATGLGSWEACGLTRQRLVQTGTLGKALGTFGGFVAAERTVMARCRKAPAFVGSTALPPPYCAAALVALRLLRAHVDWIDRLQQRALEAKMEARRHGLALPLSAAPVMSVPVADDLQRERVRAALLASGIFPSYTTYPGGPAGGHFRFALSSAHTDAQVQRLLAALATAAH